MRKINVARLIDILYFYILALLGILSESVMWGFLGSPFPTTNVYKYGFYALIIIRLFAKHRLSKKDLKVIIFAFFYFLLYILIRPINVNEYFSTFITAIITIYIFFCVDHEKCSIFFYAFSNLAILTACISLAFYFFSTLGGLSLGGRTTSYYWAENYYSTRTNFYLYFHNSIQDQYILGRWIYRNVGIFAEAPGYAMFLVEALIVELFIKDKINVKRSIILIFTIFTTFSAMGYLMVFLCFTSYFISRAGSYSKNIVRKLIRGIIFVWIIIVLGIIGVYAVLLRMQGGSATSIRLDDLHIGLKLWTEKPFLGYGYMNYDPMINNFSVFRNNKGVSMGLSTLLATGGLYLTLPFFLPIIITCFSKAPEKKKNILICAIFLVSLFFSVNFSDILYLMFTIGIFYFSLHGIRTR